ncbi:hypothetical protein ACJMK2_019094 [Sinanodonta woodiana]|uniref:Uncharacterized protein n=1 Tax=Sinanodonta woodiana TaxID=1069815 RepID=A0ABD3UHF3_SINWO
MLFLFFKGISYTLYRQLCRGDEMLCGWRCQDCSFSYLDTEVTCTFNINPFFKVTKNKVKWSIQEPTLEIRQNNARYPDIQIALTGS